MLENLERRRLFAIPVAAGVATINGTANDDVLEVINNSGVLQVRDASGTVLNSVSMAGITRIEVNGGSGSDFIRLGRGNGTLMPAVAAVLAGNGGNDTLIGGTANDQLYGAAGDDNLDGRAGADLLDGGDGFDTIDYGTRTNPVVVTLTNAATGNDGTKVGDNSSPALYNDKGGDNAANIEAVIGGTAADVITGNIAANWLDGGGGNDTIYGGAGIDTIVGGVNNDLAYGEGDDDTFLMQDGSADKFLGTPGVTYAQYDAALDSPAVAQAVAAAAQTLAAPALARAITRAATAGTLSLDTSFGLNHDGKQVIGSGAGSLVINDVTTQQIQISETQTETKIVAVGTVYYSSEAPTDFVVMRFNADGSLDSSFGPDKSGILFTDFSIYSSALTAAQTAQAPFDVATDDAASSVTIDSQGRILVAGTTAFFQSFPDESQRYVSEYAVARYLTDGSLDPNFGDIGRARIDPNETASVDSAARIVPQMVFNGETYDEEYLVVGTVGPYVGPIASLTSLASFDSADFGLIRIDSAGNMDTEFGLVQEDFGNGEVSTDDAATGLDVDPATGNIWVSGNSFGRGAYRDFAVAGYDSDGALLSYGKQTITFSADASASDSIIAGRNLIIVGTLPSEGGSRGAIAAISIDAPVVIGVVAAAAINPGTVITSVITGPSGRDLFLSGVSIDADGAGVAVGTTNNDMYVYRFNTDDLSSLGTAFTQDIGESFDSASAVVVQPDGKYVVIGSYNAGGVGMIRLSLSTEERWVDVNLNPTDVQTPGFFTYTDPNGLKQPVPTYLVWRYTRLLDDGTWTIDGTGLGETFDLNVKNGIVSVTRDGEYYQEPLSLVKKIVINASGGSDLIRVPCDFKIPLRINAGDGNDTVVGGNANDEIYGDAGADLLLGSGGNDTVKGGTGRDILIGGAGRDSLDGQADDDVLVAGVTIWDNSSASLQKLMDEWQRTDLTYQKRVKHLTDGGGLNGYVVLNSLTTFSARSVPDTLTGGSDLDTFFGSFRQPGDIITDRIATEIITSNFWLI